MFVAAIAGVFAEIIVQMARRARRVVFAFQRKQLRVIEGRRLPTFLPMAVGAGCAEVPMEIVFRLGMAACAVLLGRAVQQGVRECDA